MSEEHYYTIVKWISAHSWDMVIYYLPVGFILAFIHRLMYKVCKTPELNRLPTGMVFVFWSIIVPVEIFLLIVSVVEDFIDGIFKEK